MSIDDSVQFSRSVVSDSLRPHESQHSRPPCPSQTPGVYSNICPSSQWCHPAISSSVVPFSSCPQSLPASGSFPMSQLFAWGGQSIGVSASASVLPMNTQDWSALGWTWLDWWLLLKKLNSTFSLLFYKFILDPGLVSIVCCKISEQSSAILCRQQPFLKKQDWACCWALVKTECLRGLRSFSGGSVAKTLNFQGRGPECDPWSGN